MGEKRKTEDWTIKEYQSMLLKRVRMYSNPEGIWGNNDSSFEGIVESVTAFTDCQNVARVYLLVDSNQPPGSYAVHPTQWIMIEVVDTPTKEELLTHPNERLRDACLAAHGQ